MRPQSVKQQIVSYTRLEKQGLAGMIDRSEDVLKMLEERAFISIEGQFMSIYSVFLEKLEARKMEYQLKWFANGELHSSPHTEISLPHFIDDRVLLPSGLRGERQIRPPHPDTRMNLTAWPCDRIPSYVRMSGRHCIRCF